MLGLQLLHNLLGLLLLLDDLEWCLLQLRLGHDRGLLCHLHCSILWHDRRLVGDLRLIHDFLDVLIICVPDASAIYGRCE